MNELGARGPEGADAAFKRALAEVVTASAQLVAATNGHDSERVRHIATKATNMWFDAHAALRLMVSCGRVRGPLLDAAKAVLSEHRRDLLRLFDDATATILAPEMRHVLRELREILSASGLDGTSITPSGSA